MLPGTVRMTAASQADDGRTSRIFVGNRLLVGARSSRSDCAFSSYKAGGKGTDMADRCDRVRIF